MAGRTDPFDDPHSRPTTPSNRGARGYNLTESYVGEEHVSAPPYNGYGGNVQTGYPPQMEDPRMPYGQQPMRTASPYSTESNASRAWEQRQVPGGAPGAIQRFQTKKIKLQQGSVLSIDHPVPSAIQNSVQARYRNDLEAGSEEFTHMRCEYCKI